MTRKKSRPTHRENADIVPSNEGGFYKMFWNSMETNPGTNAPNSPSQGDVFLTSPPVIIIDDSPAGSPCGIDENVVCPLPVKEENCAEAVNDAFQLYSSDITSENPQEFNLINGVSSPQQTCLPDNPLRSTSMNNSPTPALQIDLNSELIANEIGFPSRRPEEASEHLVETMQVGEHLISDKPVAMLPDGKPSSVVNTDLGPEDVNVAELSTYLTSSTISGTFNLPEQAQISGVDSEVHNIAGIASATESIEDLAIQTPLSGTNFSTEGHVEHEDLSMDDSSNPPLPALNTALRFLKSLLNAPNEELENIAELPALVQNSVSEQNEQSGEAEVEFELAPTNSAKESNFCSDVNVSDMEMGQSTNVPEIELPVDDNVTRDQMRLMEVDEEEAQFPNFINFLPKKIKLDSVGISRSVRVLKDSMRALYREFLKDDVILRTGSKSEPSIGTAPESSVEVEETQPLPSVNYPVPICCVKMERLPDPILKKDTITMSDETFKIWKKQIIRQRNEEKFRNLKVWRRGRTLLWRECELAGMDQATYDEQVAYVKKHKLNESSSDSDSGGDDSGNDAPSHQFDSSEESSDEELDNNKFSSLDSHRMPSHIQKINENQSIFSSSPSESTTANHQLPDTEYVVERSSANQSSTTVTPSALKITIRKTSMSKSEEDTEKPADEEVVFPVPAQNLGKSRKVATKRTFRRPSDPVPKPSVPSKTAAADLKKSKIVEDDSMYDQSLLGRRSYEVENFNLLEKWDIPFEEPTLFRSPRAASRLAQIKTKEAFNPVRHRQATPKSTNAASLPTTVTTATTATAVVSKEVREVVDFLCSKTVEAMLFPRSLDCAKKLGESGVDGKDAISHTQPTEMQVKISVLSDETSSVFDESSEISQSETNSTLDASSDFGGSTASLASEDFVQPKNKSPQKPRRRRRVGSSWGKKKKVKGKGTEEQSEIPQSNENENLIKAINSSSSNANEPPATENVIQEKGKSDDVDISHVHSTQVPVVSEGPGQSPHESEDDSARQVKQPTEQDKPIRTVYEFTEEEPLPAAVSKAREIPKKRVQNEEEEEVQPRLTRSRQPTVHLDMELLQNIGARKRKPKADASSHVSQEETRKKPKQELTKKAQIGKHLAKDELSPTSDLVPTNDLNTQVPEVSEGPGEVALNREVKQGQENRVETIEPQGRLLRSRSRGPAQSPAPLKKGFAEDKQKIYGPVQVEEDNLADKNKSEDPLDLESPQSPPPEPSEPLINTRITRSKKRRSGPAYIAVKSPVTDVLPSVCDVVDSIAGQRLPTPSKLFDGTTSNASLPAEPITLCKIQTPNSEDTLSPLIPTSSSGEPSHQVIERETPGGSITLPPKECSCMDREHDKAAPLMDSSNEPVDREKDKSAPLTDSSNEPVAKPGISMECSMFGEPAAKSVDGNSLGILSEKSQQAAAVHVDVDTSVTEKEARNSGDSGAGLAVEKSFPENVGDGRLEVLDTLNNILAVSSPTKVHDSVGSVTPPSNHGNLPISPVVDLPAVKSPQPLVRNVIPTPSVSSGSLPTFPTSTQDINSILPGTLLNYNLFSSAIDANLTPFSNVMSDSTSLPEDPDGDLVIDEGDAPEADTRIDVNFWENLTNADLSDTNADFSDDDNNTDLADKIDKIIKDQIHQDPVPVPSLKQKENSGSSESNKETPTSEIDKNTSTLKRRDSIDERTGLPNNFIQRLRDPRIRSRLLSHLEEVENSNSPQSTLVPILNTLANNVVSTTAAEAHPTGNVNSDPRKKVGGVAVHSVGYPISVIDSSRLNLQAPAVTLVTAHPVLSTKPNNVSTGLASTLAVPNTPLVEPASPCKLPLVAQGQLNNPENLDAPEQVPDPSKVDFLVPPSDDEEEESIKRRPPKKKKEVDVELMYKSPLEDLQTEARPAYGERAPRRYADNFPRRRSGDDRRSRIDDPRGRSRDHMFEERGRSKSRDRRFEERGRSRSRDPTFEDRGRSRSRDERFEDRGRSQSRGRFEDRGRDRSKSRDRRSFYDRPPRDYDLYSGGEEHEIAPHHADMQPPYNHSPWPGGDPSYNHPQPLMMHPPRSPRWQPNYHPEPNHPLHPPIFMPEPPKIDYMETRLINLELLPKTTNLEISPLKKVYAYFDKDSFQLVAIPPPMYDPNEKPETIKMLDPVSQEMIDFIQTPRPTSGLTKEYFRHVAPELTLEDVIKYHSISPAYLKVRDNEEDSSSSSSDEELDTKHEMPHHHKSALEHKKRLSKQVLDHIQRRESQNVIEHSNKKEAGPVGHHVKKEDTAGDQKKRGSHTTGSELEADPLKNILQNLPLLREQYAMKNQPPLIPPPPPEWNDVDLRIARGEGLVQSTSRNPSPPKSVRSRSRSRSSSPYKSKRSRSPRRRRRRSPSSSPLISDMSISPSRSRSRSPSYSRSRTSRRRRSRSRSSEKSWSRRSRSPKRRSTSVSPSRKYSRR